MVLLSSCGETSHGGTSPGEMDSDENSNTDTGATDTVVTGTCCTEACGTVAHHDDGQPTNTRILPERNQHHVLLAHPSNKESSVEEDSNCPIVTNLSGTEASGTVTHPDDGTPNKDPRSAETGGTWAHRDEGQLNTDHVGVVAHSVTTAHSVTVARQHGSPKNLRSMLQRDTYHVSKEMLSDDIDLHAMIEKLFPELSQCNEPSSKKQLQTISTLVSGCMNLKTIFPDCDTREEKARLICQQIFNHHTQRAFFQLLSRWARRKKCHFMNDAFNTLLVLIHPFPGKQLSAFLLESRDFRIGPPKNKRRKVRVSYIAVGDQSMVQKIDREILLTYCNVSMTHSIFLSRVRMASVRHEQVFSVDAEVSGLTNDEPLIGLPLTVPEHTVEQKTLPNLKKILRSREVPLTLPLCDGPPLGEGNKGRNKGGDASDDDESVGSSSMESTKFVLNTAPQLGYHMPKSFTKRIWSNVMSLRLGFELYRILFSWAIIGKELYKKQLKNRTNDRILQFLLSSTEERDTRRRYMEVLVELCFLFGKSDKVELHTKWLLPCFAPGKERQLPPELLRRSVTSFDQKCRSIVDCYRQCFLSRLYHLDCSFLKRKDQLERKYQTVRFLVFHYWMRFKVNVELLNAVERELYGDTTDRNELKAKVSKKKTKSTVPPVNIPQAKRRCQQKRLVLPMVNTFYVARSNVKHTTGASNVSPSNVSPSNVSGTPSNVSLSNVSPNVPPINIVEHSKGTRFEQVPPSNYKVKHTAGTPSNVSPNVPPNKHVPPSNEKVKHTTGTPSIFSPNVPPIDLVEHSNGSRFEHVPPSNDTVEHRTGTPTNVSPNVPPIDIVEHSNVRFEHVPPSNYDVEHTTTIDKVERATGTPSDVLHASGSQQYDSFLGKGMKESDFTIANASVMDQRISSQLVIERDNQFFCLESAPLEIYLASNLRNCYHWRQNSQRVDRQPSTGPVIKNSVVTYIPAKVDYYVDKATDVLSVVRATSPVFARHNFSAEIFHVLLFCARHGTVSRRHEASYSRVLDFGIKAELQSINHDIMVYGQKYFNLIESQLRDTIRQSIGNMIDFIWRTCNEIQKDLEQPSLGGDRFRDYVFASRVRELLCAQEAQFESVTIIHTLLSGEGGCNRHKDKFNDDSRSYQKTAAMNIVAFDVTGDYHLLQIVCNFRWHVGRRCGFKSNPDNIDDIVSNIQHYHWYLQRKYEEKYLGEPPDFFGNPIKLQSFYLDDSVASEWLRVTPNTNISQHFVRLPIGTSRTLSLSGFLAPTYMMMNELDYSEILEILFFASFLSTPATFNYAFVKWRETSSTSGIRAFYGVAKIMRDTFGSISSGIEPRFQPCNHSIELAFGHEQNEEGIERLSRVVRSLNDWILFIDKFVGKEDADDVPLSVLNQKMEDVISSVKVSSGTSSLDFNKFRLSIFTTLVSGIGIPEPGKHLHQFFFPTVGNASYNHILKPSPRSSASKEIRMNEIDAVMKAISHCLNLKTHRRDYIEVHMCESVPGRFLEKRDLFVVGQNIFENNTNGVACFKEYGSRKDWVPICRRQLKQKKQQYGS